MDRNLYIFIHIPKCAGTTLRENILLNYSSKEVLCIYKKYHQDFSDSKKVENFISNLSEKRRKQIKVIIGHIVHYGIHKLFLDRVPQYVTFLRNPFDRIFSFYNYHRTMLDNGINVELCEKVLFSNGEIMDFGDEWLSKNNPKTNNRITSFLYSRFYGKNLRPDEISETDVLDIYSILNDFYFVGLTENKEDIHFFYHLLGLKKFRKNENVSKKFFIPQDFKKLKKEIFPYYKYDLKLYNYAKMKNNQFKNNYQNFEQDTLEMESEIFRYHKGREFYQNCKLRFKKLIQR